MVAVACEAAAQQGSSWSGFDPGRRKSAAGPGCQREAVRGWVGLGGPVGWVGPSQKWLGRFDWAKNKS